MEKLHRMKGDENNKTFLFPQSIKNTLLLLLLPFCTFSQDSILAKKKSPLQLHGYVKALQSVSFTDDMSSLLTGNLVHNRLNFRWDITPGIYLRAEARNRLFYGEQVKSTYRFGKYIDIDNGMIDLSYNVIDDTTVVLNTMLDRLLLNWSNSKWDITLGRQRINWGVNVVWNPNDIFNAFNYFDFDYEERPGTDAIRVQYFSGASSSFELAYKISDKEKEQVGALMYKTNFMKYDLQNFAGIYFEDIVAGTGWAGNIKNTGFKGEASYFHPYRNIVDTTGTLSASVSFDRSFKNDFFAMVSYLYNSDGRGFLFGSNALTGTMLSAKQLMPFEHSFMAQVSKSINPLVNGSLAAIFSPRYKTLIALPSVTVSMSDNWDLALVVQSFFYENNKVYRSLGNGIYLRFRWSF